MNPPSFRQQQGELKPLFWMRTRERKVKGQESSMKRRRKKETKMTNEHKTSAKIDAGKGTKGTGNKDKHGASISKSSTASHSESVSKGSLMQGARILSIVRKDTKHNRIFGVS